TIIDPGVKADPTDPTYAEGLARDAFVRQPNGALYTGVVWPGESVFPDFSRAAVREWWGERHSALLDVGVAGVWDDMNEPSLTDLLVPGAGTPHGTTMAPDAVHHPDGLDGPAMPHAEFHNAYGMQMARASFAGQTQLRPDRRPFTLTRSGYAGIQRYAAVWTGDNLSRWEHLRLAARTCLNLGLSGVPFVGFDTGGFWENATGELLTRFTQLGSVFPFFRNHSAMDTMAQEPWAFGQPYEAFIRAAIEQRYRLLPYLYTLCAEAAHTGAPITRAMAYAWPDDATLAALDDQFLLGAALLVAPALEKGQMQREVLFPPDGVWRDWLTGYRYTGPLRMSVDARLDMLPLYLREGAILPLGPVMQYVGELAPQDEALTLVCSLGLDEQAQAAGDLYEDDGATPAYQQGAWRRTHFTAERAEQRVILRAEQPEGTYAPIPREVMVELRLLLTELSANPPRPQVTSATLDGRALDPAVAAQTTPRRFETLLTVTLGRVAFPFTLEVALG
ncbi:MAG: TIM-barrel domain-containing protein, partial [Ktedonobacterales bacterium]